MGLLTYTTTGLVANQPENVAEIKTALDEIKSAVNGNLSDANLAAASAIETKMGSGANGLAKGCFMATRTTNLAIAGGNVETLFACDSEDWDVSSWFDTGNGRFTPQLAGYYRLTANVAPGAGVDQELYQLNMTKNGALAKRMVLAYLAAGADSLHLNGSVIVQANGSTDYFIPSIRKTGAASTLLGDGASSWFSGELIGRP